MSADAERAVIGSLLISRTALEDVASVLKPHDFEDWKHSVIYGAALALLNAGDPVDVITVTDRLIAQHDLERFVEGAAYLHELTSLVAVPSSAKFHAATVLEASRKRQVLYAAQSVVSAIEQGGDARAFDLAYEARDKFDEAMNGVANDVPALGWHFDDVVADLAEPPTFTPTPWDDLNPLIDGWRPGALYIVGARPGHGKSIFGLMAAAGLAKHGPVAMCSLEMSQAEVLLRLISAKADVLLKSLTRHALSPHQWDQIAHHREKVTSLPLFVDDTASVSIEDVRAHVRSVSRRGPLAGVVVDYLQLISTPSGVPRWESIGVVSRQLKAIAREYNVPVIALAQLNNRDSDQREGYRPTMGNLRESGSLEQDADVVVLLQRVWSDEVEGYLDEIEVIVGKNRHGEVGAITLAWQAQFARMVDMSRFT